jgi:hypothetical protein
VVRRMAGYSRGIHVAPPRAKDDDRQSPAPAGYGRDWRIRVNKQQN